MKNDFRDLAATLVNDKLKEYLDKRLAIFQSEFEKKLSVLKSDVAASTDISLETGSKVDNFMKLFQGAFAGAGAAAPKTLTVAPSESPKPTEYPKIAVSPTLPKMGSREKESPKGFDALEQMRIKQRVDAVTWLDAKFELSDLEGRILYFLLKCGPHTAHELKTYGVWRIANPVTYFLEEMEANGLVKLFATEKKWGITEYGIAVLNEDVESVAVQPVVTSDIVTQAKPSYNGTKGGPMARHATQERSLEESAKPTLTVVPSGPRILKAIEPTPNVADLKLTFVEKALIVLLKREMTIEDLQKAIGHTSGSKSLINMLWNCKQKDGYVEFFYDDGKVYRLTEKGRAYITKIVSQPQALAAN